MGKKEKDENGRLPEYDFKGAVKGKYADRLWLDSKDPLQ